MEAGSDEENQPKIDYNNKNMSGSNDGLNKPKRQMKTPFQLETLEKVYAVETYPSEAVRLELSEKLGLTDRQLQMWFCHRRLKDKKENPAKRSRKSESVMQPESPVDEMRVGLELDFASRSGSGSVSGSGSGSSPYLDSRMVVWGSGGSRAAMHDEMPVVRMPYESSPQSVIELKAIACVEAQLGESLREDGPSLGMEFDPLPPDAFGALLAPAEHQKRSDDSYENKVYQQHDARSSKGRTGTKPHQWYQFIQDPSGHRSDGYGQGAYSHLRDLPLDGPRGRTSSYVHGSEQSAKVPGVHGHVSRSRVSSQQDKSGHIFSSAHAGDGVMPERESLSNNRSIVPSTSHPILGVEDQYLLSDGQNVNNDAEVRMDRKRKQSDEARIAREVEAQEIRIRKELEKQDILRRKNEERMRRELEKHERERRKEEERLMRERLREEERLQREQKREMERREKFLQKEHIRAEKQRQKEEIRREKEAVRRKMAVEKATARKIAKESMDLIEDEQLELMELAASSKGLSSIIHLDYDTMQSLDAFRDSLSLFPPKSVQLKQPFAIKPWSYSEENVGNLLMVWRFLITFADVLELWPFTLDEFIQSFHDYDSRLLGEIHITLLKSLIKDIEDVARTPSTGLGMNQYTTANPEGGHPHIVEGAYTWGFDIRNWQKHLNPLTWPEILRQLALSAGFGPQLKQRSARWAYMRDNDEGRGCEDAIVNLRNGSAAESAFALMREKGLLAPRRSRHRLTPGTVKFAAFHVLSLEGSKGLTVLELADKIQKSGLRDLTTSKTPEASISVALTRDAKLFERIAPSTYCVRAAYSKDPSDADAILAAARKKIRIFENGFLGGEDADDVERDEDSDCDVDEDPEVDDLGTLPSATKVAQSFVDVNDHAGHVKDKTCTDVALDVQNDIDPLPPVTSKHANSLSLSSEPHIPNEGIGSTQMPQKNNVEIDESKSGESWVQGLTEGDYSHLSVEERLNALVALIGIANEGNAIRAVLEDRMEAANALKKQMWAEAQVDKSRLKEEIINKQDCPSFMGVKAEPHGSTMEGSQTPLMPGNSKMTEGSSGIAEDQKPLQGILNHFNNCGAERTLFSQDAMCSDNIVSQQHGYASKRSRSQLKSYIAHRAEEMYIYRSLPLGQDRRHNRYWQFSASASRTDPSAGRIFVELHDGKWRLIDTEEAFEALYTSLDTRGTRESHLRIMLQKIEVPFKEHVRRALQFATPACQSGNFIKIENMDSSPDYPAEFDSPSSAVCGLNSEALKTSHSFRVELGRNDMEKQNALKRYQDFQKWTWLECYSSLPLCARKYAKERCTPLLATCDSCFDSNLSEYTHCMSCQRRLDTSYYNDLLSEDEMHCERSQKLETSPFPLGIRLLKALASFMEASVPPEALASFWTEEQRKNWGMQLNVSSYTAELLQVFTMFESAIRRDFLSSNFETTKELLGSNNRSRGDVYDYADQPAISVLPWIPQTSAAVALRLFELDASIMYVKQEQPEPSEDNEYTQYNKLPSRYSPIKGKEVKEFDLYETLNEDTWVDLGSRRKNYKRGRGGPGRKVQKKGARSKSESGRRYSKPNENLTLRLRQQGHGLASQSSGRGRRTVRKRTERRSLEESYLGRMADFVRPKSNDESPSRNLEDEWGGENERMMDLEGADDSSNSMEAVESDDNVQGVEEYEQRKWEVGYSGASNEWNGDLMEESEEEDDEDGNDALRYDMGMGMGMGRVPAGHMEEEIEMMSEESSDGMDNKVGNDDEGLESDDSEEYSD